MALSAKAVMQASVAEHDLVPTAAASGKAFESVPVARAFCPLLSHFHTPLAQATS